MRNTPVDVRRTMIDDVSSIANVVTFVSFVMLNDVNARVVRDVVTFAFAFVVSFVVVVSFVASTCVCASFVVSFAFVVASSFVFVVARVNVNAFVLFVRAFFVVRAFVVMIITSFRVAHA